MSREPLISVLMPAFQAVGTLEEAVGSVLAQSLGDWELIVADDGSDDGTRDLAESWVRRDPRIRVIAHPDGRNHGRPATRNLTVAAARGTIVAFLDADDLLLAGALAAHREALDRHPGAAVSYGRAVVRGGARDGAVIGRGEPERVVGLLEQLARFNVLVTSATAVRRTALAGDPFPEDMPLCQDWACWLEIARCGRFVHRAEPMAVYRYNPGGGTATMHREQGTVGYELLQVRHLRRALAGGSPAERHALRSGLGFRASACLLRAAADLRRGRFHEGYAWLAAARTVAAGEVGFPRVAALAVLEQRRIWRGEDPKLRLDVRGPAHEPPQSGVEAGERRERQVGH